MIPDDLLYSTDHEWIRREGDVVRVGITDYAQQALGDIVYVSPAEVGGEVTAGAALGEVESTKSVSDVFAPVNGTVSARNEALDSAPELLNSDPYGDGWLVEIRLAPDADVSALLDAAAYGTHTGGTSPSP